MVEIQRQIDEVEVKRTKKQEEEKKFDGNDEKWSSRIQKTGTRTL